MKNKKLNRKHYIGNALTNAFFPVLASLGITLGAVATTVTLQTRTTSGEVGKNHTIEIDTTPQPGHEGWKMNVFNQEGEEIKKAKFNDVVTFYVSKDEFVHSDELEQDPTEVLINDHRFPLEYIESQKLKATITIPFVENMTAKLLFPKYDNECVVSFYENETETSQRLLTQLKTPKNKPLESLPSAPTLTGHEFQGWFDAKSGGNKIIAGESGTIIETDMSIYAQWTNTPTPEIKTMTIVDQEGWKLKVTDKDGKEITSTTPIEKGMKVNFAVSQSKAINTYIPTKVILTNNTTSETSSFNLKESGDLYIATNIEIPYDSNITASYSIEDVKPEERWIVAFNTVGGTDVSSQKVWDGETIKADEVYTEKSGFKFDGWYDNPEYTGSAFSLSTPIRDNMTLYAKWTNAPHSVKFYLDWNSESKEFSQWYETVDTDEGNIPNPQKGDPTRKIEGKTSTFLGWQEVNEDKTLKEVGLHPATKDTNYVAKWKDEVMTCTIAFDSSGGEPASFVKTVNYGEKVTPDDVKKDGHTLFDWKDEDNIGFDFNQPVKRDMQLHATWSVNKHTCKYVNTDGTTVLGEFNNVLYNTIPSTPTDPEKPSVVEESHTYTFKGWKQISPSTTSEDIGVKPMPDSDVTYQAVFEDTPPARLALKLVVNFGSKTIESYSIDAGKKIPESLQPDPTELKAASKSFAGWYEDEECAMKPFGDSPVTRAMTLYAKIVPEYESDTTKFTTTLNDDDTLTITGYSTTKTAAFDVSIPDKLPYKNPQTQETTQKQVTKITGFLPSAKRSLLTNLNIPDSVTEIGASAFEGYTGLKTVNIENVKKIGDRAFKNCQALSEIRLSYRNEQFGDTIVDTVTDYSCGAFFNCINLSKISYVDTPSSQEAKLILGVGCFGNLGHNVLHCLALPKTLKLICKEAFYQYPNTFLPTLAFEGTEEQWTAILANFQTTWYGSPDGREAQFVNSYLKNVKCGDGTKLNIDRTK